ncbi:hypothetical protein SRHO_G00246830 [Serrasalmus rhombeus]
MPLFAGAAETAETARSHGWTARVLNVTCAVGWERKSSRLSGGKPGLYWHKTLRVFGLMWRTSERGSVDEPEDRSRARADGPSQRHKGAPVIKSRAEKLKVL